MEGAASFASTDNSLHKERDNLVARIPHSRHYSYTLSVTGKRREITLLTKPFTKTAHGLDQGLGFEI